MSRTPDELKEGQYLQEVSEDDFDEEMASEEASLSTMVSEPDYRFHFRLSTALEMLVALRKNRFATSGEDQMTISTEIRHLQREVWNLRTERMTRFVSTATVN